MARTLALLGSLLLTGCPKKISTPGGAGALLGTWVDGEGVVTTIDTGRGGLRVTAVTDHDGEVFVVGQSMVDDEGHFGWAYTVPSTSFVVNHVVIGVQGDTLRVTWSNDQGKSGDDALTRQ